MCLFYWFPSSWPSTCGEGSHPWSLSLLSHTKKYTKKINIIVLHTNNIMLLKQEANCTAPLELRRARNSLKTLVKPTFRVKPLYLRQKAWCSERRTVSCSTSLAWQDWIKIRERVTTGIISPPLMEFFNAKKMMLRRTSTRPVYNKIPELMESRTPLTTEAVVLFGL